MKEVTEDLSTDSLTNLWGHDRGPVFVVIAFNELIARLKVSSISHDDKAAVEHLFEVVQTKVRIASALHLNDRDNLWVNICISMMELPFVGKCFFPLSACFKSLFRILRILYFGHRFYFC